MNNTVQDAFNRVLDAKMGSFVEASDEYLLALHMYLETWQEQINCELQNRIVAHQKTGEK